MFWRGYFYWRIQNDSLYSDVTSSQFKIPIESPRDFLLDPYGDVLIFLSESPTDFSSVKPSEKINICPLCRPSSPLFLLLLPNPTLPICKQPTPFPPKQKSLSSQHNKLYFLKFCGHSIRVLIYRQILSIFVSNSIFLNFNI